MQQPLTTHLCPRNFLSSCPVSTLHIRTLQSPLPPKPEVFPLQEATSEPSAEKLTPLTCELYFGFKLVTTLTTLCNGRLRLCRFLEVSGNTFVILVYVSPPVTGGHTQRFAKAAHLCPVRVWRHLPSDTFHTLIVLSFDPLTTCDGSVGLNWTQVTRLLPFSQMSDF